MFRCDYLPASVREGPVTQLIAAAKSAGWHRRTARERRHRIFYPLDVRLLMLVFVLDLGHSHRAVYDRDQSWLERRPAYSRKLDEIVLSSVADFGYVADRLAYPWVS